MSSRLTDKYLPKEKGMLVLFVITIGICALMGVIRYFTPYITDDQLWSLRWLESSEYASDKPYIIRAVEWMYNWYMNGANAGSTRLGDLSAPFTVALMPNWLISSISAILIFAILYSSYKLADIKRDSCWIAAILLFLIIEIMPWHNGIAFRMYNINYVWSSAFALIVLLYFFKSDKIKSKWTVIAVIILSAVTSLMHEALSAIMLAGFIGYFMYFIINKRAGSINKSQWVIASIFFIGTLITAFSPSMIHRFGYSAVSDLWKSEQVFWWVFQLPPLLYIIVGTLYLIRHKDTNLLFKHQQIFFLTAALAGMFVYHIVYVAYRVCWFGLLFCIIGFCQLIAYKFRNLPPRKVKLLNAIGIVLSFLILLQLADTVRWQYKLNEMHEQVLSKYRQSTDGNVYIEHFVWHSDIPWWANLHIGYNNPFEITYNCAVTMEVPHKPRLGIIPLEVYNRKYTPENFKQATPYPVEGGYVFPIRGDSIDDTWVTVIQKYNDWHDENCESRYLKFTNRYGQELTYLQIKYHVYSEKRKRADVVL